MFVFQPSPVIASVITESQLLHLRESAEVVRPSDQDASLRNLSGHAPLRGLGADPELVGEHLSGLEKHYNHPGGAGECHRGPY